MAAPIWEVDIMLETAALLLSVLLLYGYSAGFKGLKSRFSRGLAAISGIFAAQAGTSIYFYSQFSTRYGPDLSVPLGVVSLLGLLGILMLFYLSRQ